MSDWQTFADRESLDEQLAQTIAAQLRRDIEAAGRASLAVSGGGTPANMFLRLSESDLDWSKVWITLVDERWVAVEDSDSNERLVRANLLRGQAAAAHWVSMKSAADDASAGLAEIEQRMKAMVQPFSVVVLGMGGDGHTASWFPQADNLQTLLDTGGTARLAATDPVTAPHQRITLTLPAVLRSRIIAVHITGEEKRAIIESAEREAYPIAAILQQTKTPVTVWWAP